MNTRLIIWVEDVEGNPFVFQYVLPGDKTKNPRSCIDSEMLDYMMRNTSRLKVADYGVTKTERTSHSSFWCKEIA
tara:strand:+ start:273 stop:497 length:225 start_codon:yes stop_codon:yes gene_type:complete